MPHKKFVASVSKGLQIQHNLDYAPDKIQALVELYEQKPPQNKHQQIVGATVLRFDEEDVVMDLGLKADGIVPRTEFRDTPDLKEGDCVELYVETQEDKRGSLIVSRKGAKLRRSWERIQAAFRDQKSIICTTKKRTTGGLVCDADGLEVFLPGSQVDSSGTPEDFAQYLNKELEVAILNISPAKVNVVVSRKVFLYKALEAQRKELIKSLEVGQVLEGEVKNTTKFGVFVDLGGGTGLIYIKDISYDKRIAHPDKVMDEDGNPMFFKGKKIKVVVTGFDEDKGHISLSTKLLLSNPWKTLSEEVKEGATVQGTVVKIVDHGAFIALKDQHIEGYMHISDVSHSDYLDSPHKILEEGQRISCQVLRIKPEEQDLRLGIKQLQEDPWDQQEFQMKYALNTQHQATVCQFSDIGTYMELEPGVTGYLDNSRLSWTKKIPHATKLFEKNECYKVVVLSIDQENHRIELGFRELKDSPWSMLAEVFAPNTQHQGTILRKVTHGAIVKLSHDIEVFVRQQGLEKKDKQEVQQGDTLPFVVLEFLQDEHKILISHTATYKQVPKVPYQASKKSTPKVLVSGEKATLGDVEGLSKLKEKLEQEESLPTS